MKVTVIAIIGLVCHLVAAYQDDACCALCSSLGTVKSNAGKSCHDIYQINKASRGVSGNYWINTTTGVHQVYCDMELECGGHKGGWMRIANFNTGGGDDCPTGWAKITSPVAACIPASSSAGCYPVKFSTHSVPYGKLCGMALGYQSSSTDGFAAFHFSNRSINGPYVDGISITYGTPRKHIWTYAMGNTDRANHLPQFPSNCPCSPFPGRLPPSFVHDNYYCESGTDISRSDAKVCTKDLLWDGKDCSIDNSCCSEPSLPWFYRQIPLTATDDIETRICRDEASSNEDVLVRELQLYVQ